ncbi:hypothetical protein [Deinococcus humi]|uniref:Uncharacterized protein n=1 Tax=Deinococcus humi TaxID=662880 RepID=A0A7W8NFZ7_9DEIO|nr:hypothetical protein [Deinococcus humi]MBB5362447.1 hypothetical protein [Deinococcus humi]
MHPSEMTPTEIGDQLARMYAADQSLSDDLPSEQECAALADYLGCHKEAQAAA